MWLNNVEIELDWMKGVWVKTPNTEKLPQTIWCEIDTPHMVAVANAEGSSSKKTEKLTSKKAEKSPGNPTASTATLEVELSNPTELGAAKKRKFEETRERARELAQNNLSSFTQDISTLQKAYLELDAQYKKAQEEVKELRRDVDIYRRQVGVYHEYMHTYTTELASLSAASKEDYNAMEPGLRALERE